jgi:surface protein
MPTTTGKIYLGETLVAGGAGGGDGSGWVRNAAWPALTIPGESEQKVTGLYAVYPPISGTEISWVAFLFQGAYTVDWGDGSSTEDVASNVKAEHQFVYSGCYSAAVDINSAVAGTTYYIESLGDTTQDDWNTLAGTSGRTWGIGDGFTAAVAGSTLANTTGTISTVPYRVATVTITPQAAQNLTTVNLSQNTNTKTRNPQGAGWLELALSVPNCTSLVLRGPNSVEHRVVEQVTIVAHNTTNMTSMFSNCSSLQSVPLFNTASVTNMQSMFGGCSSLQSVPLFNTASVTNMQSMFNGCASLQQVPLFNTASVTNMSSMFNGCTSLQQVPLFNTASATAMSSMFNGCTSLQQVPLFNTSSATAMNTMFQSCASLRYAAASSADFVTDASNMFLACASLLRVRFTGVKVSFTVASLKLSAAALNELFTSLGTANSGATVTVTGNPGVGEAGYDATIATAKGWEVIAA